MVRSRCHRFNRPHWQHLHAEAAHPEKRRLIIQCRRWSCGEVGVRARRHIRNKLLDVRRRDGLDRGCSRNSLARRNRTVLLHRQTGRSRKKRFGEIVDVVKLNFSSITVLFTSDIILS